MNYRHHCTDTCRYCWTLLSSSFPTIFLCPHSCLPLDPSLLADYIGALEGLKDWRRLAFKLGFTFEEVKKIKEDNKGQKEDCIMEVMNKWLQRGPSSTTPALIQALEGIQEHAIAASLHEGTHSVKILAMRATTTIHLHCKYFSMIL